LCKKPDDKATALEEITKQSVYNLVYIWNLQLQLLASPTHSFPQRLAYFGIGILGFVIAYSAGASIQMTAQEASELTNEFEGQVADIGTLGLFYNNLKVALAMFVPGIGVIIGAYTAVSTGTVFAAVATSYPELQGVSPLALLTTPFGILEILAYGLAMSRSWMVVYQLIAKTPWKHYVIPTAIEVGIVLVLLFGAAVTESQVIPK